MTISDELLMAYVDGELDARARATVEQAIESNPEMARRVERQRALRDKLRSAFDGVLTEPVPERLVDAARKAPDAAPGGARDREVIDFTQMRAEKAASATRRRWSWPEWSAIAASVVLGTIIGHLSLRSPELAPFAAQDGRLIAHAGLAEALTNQLASTQTRESATQVRVSFRSKSGDYCRTFVTRDGGGLAGLACRQGDAWALEVLARNEAPTAGPNGYSPAGSSVPAPVLQAVEERIVGEPLDAAAEVAAQKSGWR